mmetsp:Transcript_71496/g.232350  ORF Transcript_71496/g.232350 Transcript_71496/m.232350 type:complete len:235 (-) Transcript_71496:843-1547(-)
MICNHQTTQQHSSFNANVGFEIANLAFAVLFRVATGSAPDVRAVLAVVTALHRGCLSHRIAIRRQGCKCMCDQAYREVVASLRSDQDEGARSDAEDDAVASHLLQRQRDQDDTDQRDIEHADLPQHTRDGEQPLPSLAMRGRVLTLSHACHEQQDQHVQDREQHDEHRVHQEGDDAVDLPLASTCAQVLDGLPDPDIGMQEGRQTQRVDDRGQRLERRLILVEQVHVQVKFQAW